MAKANVYASVIEAVFKQGYKRGSLDVPFTRAQIDEAAVKLGMDPKNLGDIVYSFRYRRALPESIRERAPEGHVWIIRGAGTARYRFCAVREDYAFIRPRSGLAAARIPDATPGLIARYALDDEQALLAKVRYNRLIDIFTGVVCYSLQNHLRTQVAEIGQIETDEIYLGIDKQGAHYVIPVQAKGGSDQHNIVQIEQDFALCRARFPLAICRAVAAQFTDSGSKIALFSFDTNKKGDAEILAERHYVLVPEAELSEEELQSYRKQSLERSETSGR